MKRSPGSMEFAPMAYDDEGTRPLKKNPSVGIDHIGEIERPVD